MGRRKRSRKSQRNIVIGVVASIIVVVAIAAYIYTSTTARSAVTAQDGTATASVDPTLTTLQNATIGQSIQVDVNVTNIRGLWGWELNYLTFNSKVLNLTQVQEGPFLKKGGQTFFLTTLNDTNWLGEGILPSTNEALAVNSTVNGSGVIMTLTFQVLAAGTSPIILSGAYNGTETTSLSFYNNHEIEPVPGVETGDMELINCTITNGQITIDNLT